MNYTLLSISFKKREREKDFLKERKKVLESKLGKWPLYGIYFRKRVRTKETERERGLLCIFIESHQGRQWP